MKTHNLWYLGTIYFTSVFIHGPLVSDWSIFLVIQSGIIGLIIQFTTTFNKTA